MPTEVPTPAKSWSQLWLMTNLLVEFGWPGSAGWLRRFGRLG